MKPLPTRPALKCELALDQSLALNYYTQRAPKALSSQIASPQNLNSCGPSFSTLLKTRSSRSLKLQAPESLSPQPSFFLRGRVRVRLGGAGTSRSPRRRREEESTLKQHETDDDRVMLIIETEREREGGRERERERDIYIYIYIYR